MKKGTHRLQNELAAAVDDDDFACCMTITSQIVSQK